jgi:hypothetical protein
MKMIGESSSVTVINGGPSVQLGHSGSSAIEKPTSVAARMLARKQNIL